MSLFGSKKTNSSSSDNSITPDILSQVRIMGEKASSPLTASGSAPSGLPVASGQSTNPVSNPFVHEEVIPEIPQIPQVSEMPTAPRMSQPMSQTEVSAPAFAAESPLRGASLAPMPQPAPLGEGGQPQEGGAHEHRSKILIIASILAVALVLIIGIFLYLEKIKDAEIAGQPPLVEPTTTETPTTPKAEAQPALETEAFSTTRSNYLPIDPETATKDSILAQISDAEARIKTANLTEPIVLQVTDQNNIPLAMSRFAYLMEFGPGEDVLTALDEDFTIVLYTEGGQPRRGLATKLKEEQENPVELLTKLEGILPTTFRNLLYPSDLVLPSPVKFSSGSYNNSVVRYSNIAPDKGYSFDYILQEKLLFLGNAKDVTRKTLEVGVR
jgi:hypothetical protein